MRARCLLLTAFATVIATSAPAQDDSAVPAPAHDPLECYCRAQGRIFAEGESACLRMPEGPRMAECRMVINVMSWAVTERPCPTA